MHESRAAVCCCCTDRGGGRRTVDEADPEVEDRTVNDADPEEEDRSGAVALPEVENRSGAVAPRKLRPPPRQGFVPPEDDIHERIKRPRWRAPRGAPMAGSGSESE